MSSQMIKRRQPKRPPAMAAYRNTNPVLWLAPVATDGYLPGYMTFGDLLQALMPYRTLWRFRDNDVLRKFPHE